MKKSMDVKTMYALLDDAERQLESVGSELPACSKMSSGKSCRRRRRGRRSRRAWGKWRERAAP